MPAVMTWAGGVSVVADGVYSVVPVSAFDPADVEPLVMHYWRERGETRELAPEDDRGAAGLGTSR